jgi:hypothetical protein
MVAQAGVARLAERLANSAVTLASETDYLMLHADALRDRANVLLLLGRDESAARDLERAIALYDRKGIRVSAQAARREYEALGPDVAAATQIPAQAATDPELSARSRRSRSRPR